MDKPTIRTQVAAVQTYFARQFWSSETLVVMIFAIIVGVGAAFGTIVFIWLISLFQNLFFGTGASVLGFLGSAYVIVLPALGGLLVGPLVHFLAPEAKGHGVPEVLTAIATRAGRIRPVVVLAKALGSAITIGSGGSVGREGPIVQIGSALGSTIGQVFKLSERRTVNLVASGAAAGIAATFNAPIAGVMFALEIILSDFEIQTSSAIFVSAVTASVLSRALLGDFPAFVVPAYTLKNPLELLLYLGLGVVSALGALTFVKVLDFFEETFDNWKFPPYLKPVIGGLGLGLVGFVLPQVFGTGFTTITDVLGGKLGLGLLAALIVGKILATCLTLGSGASGGVFAPALFIGAVLGGAYGEVVHALLPGVTATSGAYAMVGMAAVFAAAARAPITAIVILFEMTQDYHIVLPLMFATVVSTILARRLEKESIYTLKLVKRGLHVRVKREINLMRAIRVEEAMTPAADTPTVPADLPLPELAKRFGDTAHHGFVVLDEQGQLFGIVTLSDLERVMEGDHTDLTVRDICTQQVVTVFPDETLEDALRHFGVMDVGRIPVVDRHQRRQLVGVLRRSGIIRAYSQLQVDRQKREQYINRLQLESSLSLKLMEVDLRSGDAAAGKCLKDITLPGDCVVVSIQRGRRTIVPRGNTQLLAGDRVIASVTPQSAEGLRNSLTKGDGS